MSKRISMPGFIKPQLATLKSKAPKAEQWLHEIKYDGYRVHHVNRGKKKVYTRNGLDWTKRFSTIAGALDIPGEAIIEVVVVHEQPKYLPKLHRFKTRELQPGSKPLAHCNVSAATDQTPPAIMT